MPKVMRIALYGGAATGKTTIAKVLSKNHVSVARHCGVHVVEAARRLSLRVDQLPDPEHERIDRETRLWIQTTQTSLAIEGRYLDLVLVNEKMNISFVKCYASIESRAKRLAIRLSRDVADDEVEEMDMWDWASPEFPDTTLSIL